MWVSVDFEAPYSTCIEDNQSAETMLVRTFGRGTILAASVLLCAQTFTAASRKETR